MAVSSGLLAADALASQGPFAIVISDLGMADGDGFEVVRAVRANASDADVRVVALTANAVDEQRQRALDAGFDAYLSKPIAERALLAALLPPSKRSASA